MIVTPELVIAGKGLREGAVTVPGPATRPFEEIARQNQVSLVLGLRQRDDKAVYNSAVLIAADGKVQGAYHKVHLATGEDATGVTPGDRFSVFPTPIGPIGCLICMDTMLSESSRMLALGGADIICMPIMGDLLRRPLLAGPTDLQREPLEGDHAHPRLDNQVCMVVARNDVQGSCIIDRKGDILAWNEGDREFLYATLPADDGYRMSDGSDLREVTFLLRRPHLYGPFADPENLGSLGPVDNCADLQCQRQPVRRLLRVSQSITAMFSSRLQRRPTSPRATRSRCGADGSTVGWRRRRPRTVP